MPNVREHVHDDWAQPHAGLCARPKNGKIFDFLDFLRFYIFSSYF